jgi:glyoxylase-like metal-dependent hydrolase (beta-lactamase superfamily II)
MEPWICKTCGVEYEPGPSPPSLCPICEDERQWVPRDGQQWITASDLAREHRQELREEEPGLLGVGIEPAFGIGQRALLVLEPEGNVLFDCVALVEEEAAVSIEALGGIQAICFSHPHFYGAAVSWSERFSHAPIWVPEVDKAWFPRASSSLQVFSGSVELLSGVHLIQVGGHFPGSSVLLWEKGANGKGALLVGDTLQVVPATGWLSAMWSYPNLIPLPRETIEKVRARIMALSFDRIYGGWWNRVVEQNGKEAVQRSLERYEVRLEGPLPELRPKPLD